MTVILDEMDVVLVEGCARYCVQQTVENRENYREHCRLQP